MIDLGSSDTSSLLAQMHAFGGGYTTPAVQAQRGVLRVAPLHVGEPGPGELLIRVRSTSVNGADLRVLRESAHTTLRPGIEFAGEVLKLGSEVAGLAPGDRVMGLVPQGAHAELLIAPAVTCLPVPAGITWEVAGAVAEVFTTAHDALFTVGNLRPGERVCIHGAAGGVGTAAVQLAALAGAEIVATVRDRQLRDAVTSLAPTVVTSIDPQSVDMAGMFDLVLELVGAPNLRADVQSLRQHGRVVVVGVGAGSEGKVDLRALMSQRASIVGTVLKSRSDDEKGKALRSAMVMTMDAHLAGQIRVPIHATFPLGAAPDAYDHFQRGGKFGKVVLRP